ncbi:histidine phosphatase family protein [Shewanella halifaxensis]|uniref:histidine phosphatase family protein n=1 Tax=Shewanella halifaxensis TaxID=271098 RepID=UPI001F19F6FE|nr:histidine phosphatase family protein [Shewanella halifaxensis]
MNYTHFTMLRHGLPEQADCLLGRTNPELTAMGLAQMRSSTAALEFDLIISSPLKRCRTFAQQLADERRCRLLLDDTWLELDFGLWDGKPIAKLWQQHSSAPKQPSYSQFWHAPFLHTPPNGESSESLLKRIVTGIADLSRAYQGQHLLIISHSGVMRMLLSWLLNSQQIGNAHLSRVQLNHAATLHFNTYLDEADCLWPQLQGFNNPCSNPLSAG